MSSKPKNAYEPSGHSSLYVLSNLEGLSEKLMQIKHELCGNLNFSMNERRSGAAKSCGSILWQGRERVTQRGYEAFAQKLQSLDTIQSFAFYANFSSNDGRCQFKITYNGRKGRGPNTELFVRGLKHDNDRFIAVKKTIVDALGLKLSRRASQKKREQPNQLIA